MTVNTLEQTALTQLQQQIKTDEEALSDAHKRLHAKKLMAKALVDKANYVPFHQTKFGRGYFHTVRFLTAPFFSMNNEAELALEDPETYTSTMLLERAGVVLERCKNVEDRDAKKAKKMAISAAEMVMQLEAVADADDSKKEACIDASILLDSEVQRLRPILTPEVESARAAAIEAAVKTVESVDAD